MMLTRCPYCSTTFRVRPEQLKVRQGHVRCGKCRRVFDALRALADKPVAATAAPPTPPAPAKAEVAPTGHAELSWTFVQPAPPGVDVDAHDPITITGFTLVPTRDTESEPEAASELPTGFGPATETAPEPVIPAIIAAPKAETLFKEVAAEAQPEHAAESQPNEDAQDAFGPPTEIPAESTLAEPVAADAQVAGDDIEAPSSDMEPAEEITIEAPPDFGAEPFDEPPPQQASAPEPTIEWAAEPTSEPAPTEEPEPATEPAPAEQPSTVFGPPTIFDLHEPARESVQWPWIVGGVIALLLLAAQFALHYRTDLIATHPELRPAFAATCELLDCKIELPRKIDLIAIESSDLAPDPNSAGKLYLAATLRNRAAFAQEWPTLEVTLTDARERALLRRALGPDDYLPPEASRAEGFPARSEQLVQLTLNVTDTPAVGYRLYIFHP